MPLCNPLTGAREPAPDTAAPSTTAEHHLVSAGPALPPGEATARAGSRRSRRREGTATRGPRPMLPYSRSGAESGTSRRRPPSPRVPPRAAAFPRPGRAGGAPAPGQQVSACFTLGSVGT